MNGPLSHPFNSTSYTTDANGNVWVKVTPNDTYIPLTSSNPSFSLKRPRLDSETDSYREYHSAALPHPLARSAGPSSGDKEGSFNQSMPMTQQQEAWFMNRITLLEATVNTLEGTVRTLRAENETLLNTNRSLRDTVASLSSTCLNSLQRLSSASAVIASKTHQADGLEAVKRLLRSIAQKESAWLEAWIKAQRWIVQLLRDFPDQACRKRTFRYAPPLLSDGTLELDKIGLSYQLAQWEQSLERDETGKRNRHCLILGGATESVEGCSVTFLDLVKILIEGDTSWTVPIKLPHDTTITSILLHRLRTALLVSHKEGEGLDRFVLPRPIFSVRLRPHHLSGQEVQEAVEAINASATFPGDIASDKHSIPAVASPIRINIGAESSATIAIGWCVINNKAVGFAILSSVKRVVVFDSSQWDEDHIMRVFGGILVTLGATDIEKWKGEVVVCCDPANKPTNTDALVVFILHTLISYDSSTSPIPETYLSCLNGVLARAREEAEFSERTAIGYATAIWTQLELVDKLVAWTVEG
ncbi:hypothetical protein IAR55_007207 [Kwoniella newhampshirensis]|uniref:Uncharacterized protein n=1 Tax=Kwoniella newhampshirensis TaxID=1651941 RepID=A0AAW0YSN2_9TREE